MELVVALSCSVIGRQRFDWCITSLTAIDSRFEESECYRSNCWKHFDGSGHLLSIWNHYGAVSECEGVAEYFAWSSFKMPFWSNGSQSGWGCSGPYAGIVAFNDFSSYWQYLKPLRYLEHIWYCLYQQSRGGGDICHSSLGWLFSSSPKGGGARSSRHYDYHIPSVFLFLLSEYPSWAALPKSQTNGNAVQNLTSQLHLFSKPHSQTSTRELYAKPYEFEPASPDRCRSTSFGSRWICKSGWRTNARPSRRTSRCKQHKRGQTTGEIGSGSARSNPVAEGAVRFLAFSLSAP